MVDTQELFDDILGKLSSLRQELDSIKQTEQRRKQTEESLSHRNRLHTLLNTIRTEIIKNQSRETLFDGICRVFVESGMVHAAWIGTVDPELRIAYPVTAARIDEERFGVTVIRSPKEVEIQGKIVETVIDGDIFLSNRITTDERLEAFHETAARQQYHSLAVFPITEGGVVKAMLLLFSATVDFFTEEVVSNITLVCQEISIGLQRLNHENELREEIDVLKNSVKRYQQVSDQHFIGIAIIQKGKILYANDALADLFGYTVEEMLQWKANEFTKLIHPDDVDDVTDPERRKAEDVDGITYYSYRIITKQNKIRRIHRYSKTTFYDGDHAHLIAVIDSDKLPGSKTETVLEEQTDNTILQILFDNNPYPALLIDYDTFAVLKVNNAAISQYGYSEEEFVSLSVRELFPPEELSAFLENLTQLPLTLQLEVLTKHIKRDESVIDVEVAAKYLRIAEKTVVLLVARDVTNRKWAEEVLRESEMNYRNIFNAVGHMLLVIDRDARILELNTTTAISLQLQRESSIGQDFDIINADDKNSVDEFRDHVEKAFEIGSERFDWYVRRQDESVLPVEIVLQRGEYFGHPVVIAAMNKKDENDTVKIESKELGETLESAPTALAIANNEESFTWANQAFVDLTGMPLDDLIGLRLASLIGSEENSEKYEQMVSATHSGKVWSDIIMHHLPDGKEIQLDLTVTPIKIGDEPVSRYVITAKNYAREKEFMQQMLQKQKMESIDTISRAIAHDFNNILGIILGYTSFLEKRKDDNKKFNADIDEIKEAVQRGAKLIKQMLAYTHRNDVSYDPIDLNEVVRDVVGMLNNTFPDTIELMLDLEDELPTILMSRHQLQQIVSELCVNARYAIENAEIPDSGKGRILIETRTVDGNTIRELFPSAQQEHFVELRVNDNGIGMEEDTKSKVFDPFFTEKEFGEGKGLGLTAVYGIVRSYDGFIRVESELNKGSTFVVYIPVRQDDDKTEEPVTVESSDEQSADSERGESTILIVEDEPSLLHLLKEVLEDNNFKVITAKDGIEGVKQYEDHKDEIALVLSDVGLPKLDGFNAFLQMRRINPGVNAILASGYLDDKVKVDLYKEGVKDFIHKPYNTKEILSKIKEILNNS